MDPAPHAAPAEEQLRQLEAALAAAGNSPQRDELLLEYVRLANSLGRTDIVLSTLRRILFDERSDGAAPLAVQRFPQYFSGPEDIPQALGFDDPRLALISQMSATERLCLYALVMSLAPRRVLEIGRARGGSTLVIASALRQVPGSKFVSLDPNTLPEHSIHPALVQKLAKEVAFIDGSSPGDNPQCCAAAGGRFDLVFIDACHWFEACLADIEGILPFLADEAVLLLHDAHFLGVNQAIRTALASQPALVDCGLVSTGANYSLMHHQYQGQPSVFRGLHMLRFRGNPQERPRDDAGEFEHQSNGIARRLTEIGASLHETKQHYYHLHERHGKKRNRTLGGRVARLVSKVLGRSPQE